MIFEGFGFGFALFRYFRYFRYFYPGLSSCFNYLNDYTHTRACGIGSRPVATFPHHLVAAALHLSLHLYSPLKPARRLRTL